jgi:hypothetical protein
MKTKNLKRGCFFLILFSVSHFIYPQNKIAKGLTDSVVESKKWYKGQGVYILGAYQLSVINVQRNPFSQTLFSGWTAGLLIKNKHNPHLLIEYGTALKTNLSANWLNLREQRVNANAYFEAFGNDNNQFVTLLGISYKNLTSLYTGALQEERYNRLYRPNTKVNNTWIGINAGMGYELNVDPFSAFGIVEIPVMWSDLGFGINDFILKFGLKQKIPYKKVFKRSNDRYHWF